MRVRAGASPELAEETSVCPFLLEYMPSTVWHDFVILCLFGVVQRYRAGIVKVASHPDGVGTRVGMLALGKLSIP